jgi:hypothetical protein
MGEAIGQGCEKETSLRCSVDFFARRSPPCRLYSDKPFAICRYTGAFPRRKHSYSLDWLVHGIIIIRPAIEIGWYDIPFNEGPPRPSRFY